MKHFQQRAQERAGVANPDAVYQDLRIALADPDRWSDYIEPVKAMKEGATAYRFRTAEGIFYVVAKGAFPVTIFNQTQMASKKWAIKARKAKRHNTALPKSIIDQWKSKRGVMAK